jgi:hypothetical protein
MLRGYSRGTHGVLSENPGETLGYSRGLEGYSREKKGPEYSLADGLLDGGQHDPQVLEGYSRGTRGVLEGYSRVLPSTHSQTDYWTADNTTLKFDKCDVKSGVCSGNLTANGMGPLGSPHEPTNRQAKQQTNKRGTLGQRRARARTAAACAGDRDRAACRHRRARALPAFPAARGRRAMRVAPKLGARIKKGHSLTGVGSTRGYSGGRVRGVACLCWQARARASRGTRGGSVRAAPTDTCASARAAAQCPSPPTRRPPPRSHPAQRLARPPPLPPPHLRRSAPSPSLRC